METRKKTIKAYIAIAPDPSFNNFVQLKKENVINNSMGTGVVNALILQIIWVDTYNQCIQTKRPGAKLQPRPETTSSLFQEIFEITRLNQEIENTSMDCTTSDESSDDNDNDEYQLLVYIDDKKSYINLLNDQSRQFAFQSVPKEFFDRVMTKCHEFIFKFENSLDSVMHKIITDLFKELIQFQFDLNTTRIISYLDNEKSDEVNKESEKYTMLCVISSIIDNFNIWKREDKFSKTKYSNKFANILDILFNNTKIYGKEGIDVCESFNRMQIMNGDEIVFNGRNDVIIVSEQDNKDIELCSIQFNNNDSIDLVQQQLKNIQLNACILNETFFLTCKQDIAITYIDFIGRNATVIQIFRMENKFVIQKVGKIVIIKSLLELDILRDTMLDLFKWKSIITSDNNIVSLAHVERTNNFFLVNVVNDFVLSSTDIEQDAFNNNKKRIRE